MQYVEIDAVAEDALIGYFVLKMSVESDERRSFGLKAQVVAVLASRECP